MTDWQPGNQFEADDVEILRGVARARNDEAQLQAFVDRFGTPLQYWLRETLRDSSREDRQDAYQNLLAKLLFSDALESYNSTAGSPRGYLQRIARNFGRDVHRRKASRPQEASFDDPFAFEARLVADGAPGRSEADLVQDVWDYLKRSQFSAKRLAVYKEILREVPTARIAKQFNVGASTVYSYKRELLRIAREVLGIGTSVKKTTED